MGDALRSVVKTEKYVYRLNSPTNAVEVGKTVNWAASDYAHIYGKPPEYDDTIQIEAEDDAILVWFVVSP